MMVQGGLKFRVRGSLVNRAPGFFIGFATLLLITLSSAFFLATSATARGSQPPETTPESPAVAPPKGFRLSTIGDASSRDSLRQEIEQYTQAISGLRDSLDLDQLDFQLTEEQRLRVEQSMDELTQVLEGIGGELSKMELEISNNRISLLDDQGEGIVINIPDNLDEQLNQGFEMLQKIILDEMPDVDTEEFRHSWSWGSGSSSFPEPQRTILRGNIVKVWDNLQITRDEDVRGDVVVVFGDGEISGRVDGDVITVFGDLRLDKDAEITGQVVSIGGKLDQDRHAEVGDVVVVDPFPGLHGDGFGLIPSHGIVGVLLGLGEFILVVLLSILVLATTSRQKLDRVLVVITERPLQSLGVGMAGAVTLFLLGAVLIGVLVVTVIGIPVALLVLIVLLLLSVLSIGLAGLALGRRVCLLISGSCGSDWGILILGLFLLNGVSFLGQFAGLVPGLTSVADGLIIIGAGIKLVAYWFGMGALLLGRFGRN